MLTAYISDIHANIEALNAVLNDIESRGIKNIVVLGDVVGYGPNPGEVLDRLEEIVNTKGVTVNIIPGNHDPAFKDNLDRRRKRDPKQKPTGVGKDANDAIERQLDIIFTPNTADFLSGKTKQELLRNHPPKYPPGLPDSLKKGFEEKIGKAREENPWYSSLKRIVETVWPWAREKWVIAQHGSHSQAEALGVTIEAAAYIAEHNPELVTHLAAEEKARKRRAFLEGIVAGKKSITVNGVHCSHTNWTGGNQYLVDQFQGRVFAENGILEQLELTDESLIPWHLAVEAAQKLGRKKVRMGKAHTHIPNITEKEGLLLFDTGTVGWPRVPYLKGNAMHDVASYVVQDDDNFEHVFVGYEWKKTAEKLEAIAEDYDLPVREVANRVWYWKMHPQKMLTIPGEDGKDHEFRLKDYKLPEGEGADAELYVPPTTEEAAAEAACAAHCEEIDLGSSDE